MTTSKRKHLLAAAIILLLRRSRKRFSKWENRRIWSKTWLWDGRQTEFQNLVREWSDLLLCPKPRITAFRHFEKSRDKMAQHDWLTSLAIHGDERRKSREWAHLANAGDFNPRYPTCQISAILYADRGNRWKSQSLHRAHLAIIPDRRDQRLKSASVSPA